MQSLVERQISHEYDIEKALPRVSVALLLICIPILSNHGLRGGYWAPYADYSNPAACKGGWTASLVFFAAVATAILSIEWLQWKIWRLRHPGDSQFPIVPLEDSRRTALQVSYRPEPEEPNYVLSGGMLFLAPQQLFSGIIFAVAVAVMAYPFVRPLSSCELPATSWPTPFRFAVLAYALLSAGNVIANAISAYHSVNSAPPSET
jgi:hypothetical protein